MKMKKLFFFWKFHTLAYPCYAEQPNFCTTHLVKIGVSVYGDR